ncbi:MAG: TolC family protein [Acidobacteriota bacterium]|nr:TolC family protein [Acidobacteriota bacterium]
MRQTIAVGWSLVFFVAMQGHAAEAPFRVGIVVDGPWSLNQMVRRLTVTELEVLTEGEFDVQFPDDAYMIGDWTYETANRNIRTLLDDEEVDLVIAWGLLASHAVCCLGELPKPVIAPVVLDPALQGLPLGVSSGVRNLNYVSLPDNLAHELDSFRDIVSFRHVAIVTSATLLEAIPELVERTAINLAGTGIDFEYIPATASAKEVLEAISPRADAVYVWPLFQFSPDEYRRLIDGFIERKLASFSGLGGGDVEAGMLASAASPEFFPKLSRRIALNIQRILLGENAGDIPVEFSAPENLVINMATARAIDASPRWEVMIEADLLHAEDIEGAYELSLQRAVEEALLVNLDLIVERRAVAVGAQEVDIARSALRPLVSLSASSVTIDDDRAEASFGSQAERTLSGSAGLTQLIYSDSASANVEIQKRLQEGRVLDLETMRLDIALEAATTYLDLMRAKALERVQRNNVERTRSNLDVAEVRREIGVASAGEVLRWESEVASARKSLVESVGNRRTAEIAIRRQLHRPLDAPFLTEDVTLETPGLGGDEKRFWSFIDTPRRHALIRDFVVLQGLARSPELKRLDAAIAAQQRLLTAARRASWTPTVAFQADLEEKLSKDGAGADVSSSPLGIPLADDTNWSFALSASVPLFSGGLRAAEEVQAEIELERLQLARSAAEEKIEQRIRSALEQARASFVGIRLSEQAANAARANLELVEDAYARGVSSLLDLLDAQTNALNSEETAANSLYDFLIDLLEIQRAGNTFEILASEEERRELRREQDEFMAASDARSQASE